MCKKIIYRVANAASVGRILVSDISPQGENPHPITPLPSNAALRSAVGFENPTYGVRCLLKAV